MGRRSDKRERLLDAAAQAFWVEGYTATSLADIAELSGVPLGNIYYYFKTKTDIAQGVADIFMEETLASLKNITSQSKTTADAIKGFTTMLKESAKARSELGCPLAHAIRDFSPKAPAAAAKTNEVFETLIGWLSQTLNKGGDRQAMRHAKMAIARWQGAIILAHAEKSEQILLEIINEVEHELLQWMQDMNAANQTA